MLRLRTIDRNRRPRSAHIGVMRAVRICSLALLVACFGDDSVGPNSQPLFATIRVRATTTGRDIDADGYLVHLDNGQRATRVATNGTANFYLYGAVGTHRLVLHEIAPNCRPDRDDITITIAAASDTVTVDVLVACSAFGMVEVTLSTTGTDLDGNGYRIAVTGGRELQEFRNSVAVNATGTFVVPRVPPGRHLIRLQHVAVNCGGQDLTPREVDVVSDQTVAVSFQLVCTTATWLAYSAIDASGNSEIYKVRSNRAENTRLTNHSAKDEDPAWSPDGTRIAFTSDRDGTQAIHVMNEDGSGVTRLTPSNSASFRPAWSPDGRSIAFVSERDGNAELYVMNADGSNPVRLTNDGAMDGDPAWSPDGTRIAFSSARSGNAEIHVMNADGSGVVRLTVNESVDRSPAWSPDGNTLAFTRMPCVERSPSSCYPAVMLTTPTGSTFAEAGIGADPSWSPDGRSIAATGFVCDFYYSYGGDPCTVSGIGIVSPLVIGTSGYTEIWEPDLTKGIHHNPAWRP